MATTKKRTKSHKTVPAYRFTAHMVMPDGAFTADEEAILRKVLDDDAFIHVLQRVRATYIVEREQPDATEAEIIATMVDLREQAAKLTHCMDRMPPLIRHALRDARFSVHGVSLIALPDMLRTMALALEVAEHEYRVDLQKAQEGQEAAEAAQIEEIQAEPAKGLHSGRKGIERNPEFFVVDRVRGIFESLDLPWSTKRSESGALDVLKVLIGKGDSQRRNYMEAVQAHRDRQAAALNSPDLGE